LHIVVDEVYEVYEVDEVEVFLVELSIKLYIVESWAWYFVATTPP